MPDDIKLPALPRVQVPRIEADVSLLDIKVLARWCERTATDHARAAVLADRGGRQQWIDVRDRLPEWAMRDDTPCQLQGKPIGAHLQSQMVLVTLDSGAVRMDRLEGIEDSGAPFWQTYRQRVVAWMPAPAPADAQRAKGDAP